MSLKSTLEFIENNDFKGSMKNYHACMKYKLCTKPLVHFFSLDLITKLLPVHFMNYMKSSVKECSL